METPLWLPHQDRLGTDNGHLLYSLFQLHVCTRDAEKHLGSPGKMATGLVNLHLCAFEFIQLLPDGGLKATNTRLRL